jgi:hypothetical protein
VNANDRAHFIFQSHFDDLQLTTRQLIRAHPQAIYGPGGSSCIYRMRDHACSHVSNSTRLGVHDTAGAKCWRLSENCSQFDFCDYL